MNQVDNDYFKFKDLSPEEKEKRGILGRLYGDCADIKLPTRNGRGYSEELFDNSFKEGTAAYELLKNGGIPGECGHPADRTEIDMEKIAIIMPEKPRKDKRGKLIGYWDILDTPCGRIAYQLAKYGFKLGISSRGTGDVEEDLDGNETVNPDTYDFQCFDLVVRPAVESARLSMVESLNKRKTLNESLNELIDSEQDVHSKELMKETLDELNIDISDKKEDEGIDTDSKTNMTAEDNGVDLVEELQKSLKANQALTKQVEDLQEKLSVRYTKEAEQANEIERYKKRVESLHESKARDEKTIQSLKERADAKSLELRSMSEKIEQLNKSVSALQEMKSRKEKANSRITESVAKKENEVKVLTEKLRSANETMRKERAEHQAEIETLQESVEDLKKDSAIKTSNLELKLSQANSLLEKYKKVANTAVDKYIENQALRLGVTASEIKGRLSEHYSFAEIDATCERLSKQIVSIKKLPFETAKDKRVKVSVTESKDPILVDKSIDDEIDDSLLYLTR